MSDTPELLTAEELAARLRIRPDTVRTWSRRGWIPKVKLSPKVVRYELPAVVEAMARRQRGEDVSE